MTSAPRLPEFFHVGWVVRDRAAAQRDLSARLGAGPFVSMGENARFDHAIVHGKPTPPSRSCGNDESARRRWYRPGGRCS